MGRESEIVRKLKQWDKVGESETENPLEEK